MVIVQKYLPDYKQLCDAFVDRSKNGVFLFKRDYTEYHSGRFFDHSLLFFKDQDLVGFMPANIKDGVLVSHGGLTFGGIVSDGSMKCTLMLEVFDALMTYVDKMEINQIIYKPVPHIYSSFPAEEDLYALYRLNASLIRRDASATIDMQSRNKYTKGRKAAVKRSASLGVVVKKTNDFFNFMEIEKKLLQEKYNVNPAHTHEELSLLASRFPENVKLFAAYLNDIMVGGVIMFESQQVAHAQYIAANKEGQSVGAIDAVIDSLINTVYSTKRYFDFGISTENQGKYLNQGLSQYKESYGARTTVYDFYALNR